MKRDILGSGHGADSRCVYLASILVRSSWRFGETDGRFSRRPGTTVNKVTLKLTLSR